MGGPVTIVISTTEHEKRHMVGAFALESTHAANYTTHGLGSDVPERRGQEH